MGIFGQSHRILKTTKRLQEASPVFVHLLMVLGVALYTLFGAVVMRNLESKANPQSITKRSIYSEISNTLRNSSSKNHEIRHFESFFHQKFNFSNLLNFENSTVNGRSRREQAQVMRSRKCVIGALQKFINSDCSETTMNKVILNLIDNCYHVTVDNQEGLQDVVYLHSRDKLQIAGEDSQEYIKPWSFSESVLFAFTVITTIGYGNVAPRTFGGRLFCIFYGLIGIPFTLLAIADLGKFISEVIDSWEKTYQQCWKKIKKRYRETYRRDLIKTEYSSNSLPPSQEISEKIPKCSIEEEFRPLTKDKSSMFDTTTIEAQDNISDSTKPENYDEIDIEVGEDKSPKKSVSSSTVDEEPPSQALSLLFFFVLYTFVGAALLSAYEPDMTFFKAIYFNFVSLSSIGLGDIYPRSETYMAFTIVYIAVGLALTTIAIEIAADYLKKLHYFGRKIENVGNVAIWFGGKKLTMKQLVKNLGDQFNLPTSTIKNLDLDTFVDNAIKVEEGELETLRPPPIEPENLMIESNVAYMDDEKEEWIPQKTPTPSPTPPPKTPTPPPKTPTPPPKTPTPPPKTPTPPPKTPTPPPPPPKEPTPSPSPEPEPKPKSITAAELAAQKRRAYSEEAWRRYQEYQKQWKKFRQTQTAASPNPKKSQAIIEISDDLNQERSSPIPGHSRSASRSSSSADNRHSVSPGNKIGTSPTPGSRTTSPAGIRSRTTSTSSNRKSPILSTQKSPILSTQKSLILSTQKSPVSSSQDSRSSASKLKTTESSRKSQNEENPQDENPKTNIVEQRRRLFE